MFLTKINEVLIIQFMRYVYLITLVLDVVFIATLFQSEYNKKNLVFYIIISIIYYFINRNDVILNSALKKEKIGLVINFMLVLLKYAWQIVLILDTNSVFKNFIVALMIYFCIAKAIELTLREAANKVLFIILILILLFGAVGLESAILNWTFFTLIFISIIPQFLSKDIKYIFFGPARDYLEKDDVVVLKKVYNLKYKLFILIPFIYIVLLISEKIIFSRKFNYFYNIYMNRNIEILKIDLFSMDTLYISLFKILVFMFVIPIYVEYNEHIIVYIKKYIKSLDKNFPKIEYYYYGEYVRIEKEKNNGK